MKAGCGYIGDGYTEAFFIKESPGFHPAVRGTYRPMTVEEVERMDRERKKLETAGNARVLAKYLARWLSEKVITWDLRDGAGQTVALDADHMTGLRPELWWRLLNMITGRMAPDVSEEMPSDEVAALLADSAAAEEDSRFYQEAKADREQKN